LTTGVYGRIISVVAALSVDGVLGLPGLLLHGLLLDLLLFLNHFFVEVLVVVVTVEGLLNIVLVQQVHVLLNLLTVVILPLTICVLCVEVINRRIDLERRLNSITKKVIPGEISEPGMVLDIFRTVKPETI